MSEKHLHIISPDVPFPANYGTAIDIYHQLEAFHALGISIHLHCFDYGRGNQLKLQEYCASVHYYTRTMGHKAFSAKMPYIVSSRMNETLFQNLLKDAYPILMEGIHCTYLLNDPRFEGRKLLVRLHNIGHLFYEDMFRNTSSLFKKAYAWHEARLLKKYEEKIASKVLFAGLNSADINLYQQKMACKGISEVPAFIPSWEVRGEEGMGSYCLYHADLSTETNEKTAIWLLKNVFSQLNLPLVITGRNPSEKLVHLSHQSKFSCLVANPSEKEMKDMITKAHIHILPSFSSTGCNLQLLHALFIGRHCILNESAVKNNELESACHIGSNANAFRELILQLYYQPFTKEEITLRKKLLGHQFNNNENARKLLRLLDLAN